MQNAENRGIKVLVTGATGMLGVQLVRLLLEQGFAVRALKRPSSSFHVFEEAFGSTSLAEQVEWVEGDVLDVYSLLDAMQDIDHVYHCAAMVSFDAADVEQMMKVNINGTTNVVNMAMEAGIKKLCHVSSVAVLGRNAVITSNNNIDENTHWKTSAGNSNYAISKYGAEREVWRGIAEGLHAVIVNPSIIVGPGNWNSGSGKTFSTLWKGLKYYTLGKNGFVDVRDVASAMLRLTNSPVKGERFILSGENLSYKKYFFLVARELGCPRPTTRATPFMSELVWRVYLVKKWFTGNKPLITKETARTANEVYEYNTEKIRKAIQVDFTPVATAIAYTASRFKASARPDPLK